MDGTVSPEKESLKDGNAGEGGDQGAQYWRVGGNKTTVSEREGGRRIQCWRVGGMEAGSHGGDEGEQ